MDQLLTLPEVAQALKVSQKTVRRMVAARRIPCVKIGRSVRFLPSDVAAWVRGRRE